MQTISEIQCGEQLTVAQVADLYPRLLATLAEGQAVSIDISAIERTDAAGIQLLYGFQRDAVAQQLVIIWSQASNIFCDAVDILGMEAFYLHNT